MAWGSLGQFGAVWGWDKNGMGRPGRWEGRVLQGVPWWRQTGREGGQGAVLGLALPPWLLLPQASNHLPLPASPKPSGCTICEEHYVNGLYANPASLPARWTPEP